MQETPKNTKETNTDKINKLLLKLIFRFRILTNLPLILDNHFACAIVTPMKISLLRTVAVIALLFNIAGPLYADLEDFEKSIQEAEAEDKADTVENGNSAQESALGGFLWELFRLVWFINNTGASYSDYPYSDGKFYHFPQSMYADTSNQDALSFQPATPKSHWFALDTQAFYLEDVGGGTWITFRGTLWRFFGPYFEAMLLTDGQEFLQGTRLGGTFTIFQSTPLTLNAYFQWQAWNGILDRSGTTGGIEILSFPVKPLALQFRLGGQTFPRFSLTETELKAGWMIEEWQLNGGWRWWTINDVNDDDPPGWSGPFLGITRFF